MNYAHDNIKYSIMPQEFSKDSSKEILQYAVGGLLYMPASNAKIADKIINNTYKYVKSIVLDLEDSLGDDLVGYGQRSIVGIIDRINEAVNSKIIDYDNIPLIFIRVREYGQMIGISKTLGKNIKYITGFNIPKFSKSNCDEYIREFKEVITLTREMYPDNTPEIYIMPIIEDKETLYRQLRMENLLYVNNALREISTNVLNIRVGGADFCSVFGVRRSINDSIHDIGAVKSILNDIMNVFGKSYIVSGPVWEYFENKDNPNDTRWLNGLKAEIYKDRLNGFIGKTCIHPSQCGYVQESLIVSKEDYDDAVSILGMNTNTIGVKKGTAGNRMNEAKTHTNWAKKIIGLSIIYGVIA